MKFTTVLANGICMSDWLERAFLHGTQCKFETIQFAINARGTVEYEFLDLDKNFSETGKTAI